MEPDQSLLTIFNGALEQDDPAARTRYLDEACGGDAGLRERVAELLHAHDDAGGFFSDPSRTPAGSGEPPTIALPVTEKAGDTIARYKLLEKIGEGGCGVVYMAEQEEPVRRRVALKVIKVGMDTRQVVARFEAERQALALMNHSNIARVLDAGATGSGRPFFVMELVRGVRITEFCDEHKLSTRERLDLFAEVCSAIQHAHQKGIIHRDLKPSNILVKMVDGVPVPKVIDFGIAKATNNQLLTDKTLFTAIEQFMGTPAYMSPEQAEMSGIDVDTRSDIYSLGVVLYELLTGRTPFDAENLPRAGIDEIRRTIRETEPTKPSTRLDSLAHADLTATAQVRSTDSPRLVHQVRGDLDWVVMKCLEKDPNRRYETTNGLAMDIRRHLQDEPIAARPPGRLYRFRKLVRRNKTAFAAAGAVATALVLGVIVSSGQAIRATRAEREQSRLRERAEAEEKTAKAESAKSRQVSGFLQDMLGGVGPSVALGRDTAMLREILDKTAGRIGRDLEDQPEVEAELRNVIGAAYWELGEFDKSSAMHTEALRMQRDLLGDEHPSVAATLHDLAEALRQQGKLVESEAAFREALAMRRKLLGDAHPDVARTLNNLGSLLSINLESSEPEALLREALAIRRNAFGNEHRSVAESLDNLGHVLTRQGNLAEAAAMHEEALAIRKKVLGDAHPELLYSFANLAMSLEKQGNLPEAEARIREGLAMCEKLLAPGHPRTRAYQAQLGNLLRAQGKPGETTQSPVAPDAARRKLASSLHDAGKHLQAQGKPAEAETLFREALAIRRKLPPGDRPEVATSFNALAGVLRAQDKLPELETLSREFLALCRERPAVDSPELAAALDEFGVILKESRRWPAAEEVFRGAVAMRRKLSGDEDLDLARSLHHLAWVIHGRGKPAEAEALSREELAMRRKLLGDDHHDVAAALSDLAVFLRSQDKVVDAETTAREALAIHRKLFGDPHRRVEHSLFILASVLKAQRNYPEAESVFREQLAMEKALSGDEHPFVATSLRELGTVLCLSGKPEEGEVLFREALGMYRKLGGNERPEVAATLSAVGQALHRQSRYAEGETVYREVLALRRKLPGDDLSLAWALQDLTENLLWQEAFAEAEAPARECLALREKIHPDHWLAFNARNILAHSLLRQKKYPEAEPMLLAAYEGMKQREDGIPTELRIRLQHVLQKLVQLYEATEQPVKAAEWRRKLAAWEKSPTRPNPATARP